jgi:hypothetical protein
VSCVAGLGQTMRPLVGAMASQDGRERMSFACESRQRQRNFVYVGANVGRRFSAPEFISRGSPRDEQKLKHYEQFLAATKPDIAPVVPPLRGR